MLRDVLELSFVMRYYTNEVNLNKFKLKKRPRIQMKSFNDNRKIKQISFRKNAFGNFQVGLHSFIIMIVIHFPFSHKTSISFYCWFNKK